MPRKTKATEPVRIQVVCADDHDDMLQMLRITLGRQDDMACLHCSPDAQGVIDYLAANAPLTKPNARHPLVVLMDLTMPGSTREAIGMIAKRWSAARVLVCTGREDAESIEEVRQAGAAGMVVKTRPEQIFDAIRKVGHGERVFPDVSITPDKA